jgi:hypothetical protein
LQDYKDFLDYPVPEIQRITLDTIILQIKAMHLGDPREVEKKKLFLCVDELLVSVY